MSEERLSKGEKKFVAAYNGNIKETAAKIGLSHTYCRRIATLPYIVDKIRAREEAESKKDCRPLIADRQERQAFWASVMRGDPQVVKLVEQTDENDKAVLDDDGNPVMVEVKEVTDMKNRLRAAELLGRSNADFVDRIHVSDIKGVPKEITDKMTPKEASALYVGMVKNRPAGNA